MNEAKYLSMLEEMAPYWDICDPTDTDIETDIEDVEPQSAIKAKNPRK